MCGRWGRGGVGVRADPDGLRGSGTLSVSPRSSLPGVQRGPTSIGVWGRAAAERALVLQAIYFTNPPLKFICMYLFIQLFTHPHIQPSVHLIMAEREHGEEGRTRHGVGGGAGGGIWLVAGAGLGIDAGVRAAVHRLPQARDGGTLCGLVRTPPCGCCAVQPRRRSREVLSRWRGAEC